MIGNELKLFISQTPISRQRVLVFSIYAIIASFSSALFVASGHESAFAPMLFFCPWPRLLFESELINESKTAVIIATLAYILLIFFIGAIASKLSKPRLYLVFLLLHMIGIVISFFIDHSCLTAKRLLLWGYTVSAPISVWYYYFDYKLIRNNLFINTEGMSDAKIP